MLNTVSNHLLRPFGKSTGRQKGMTLIEIIIVVALLGTLMTILIKNITDQADNAKIDQTSLQMGNVAQALQLYRVHNNRYPSTAEGLQALLEKPSENSSRWRGPYTEANKLEDAWGQPIEYESDGRKYQLTSPGIGGIIGDEDDIYYPPQTSKEENSDN